VLGTTITSVVLALGTLLSMYLLAGNQRRAGWHLVIALQALWVPYDIAIHQYALIALTPATMWIAVKALRSDSAHKEHDQKDNKNKDDDTDDANRHGSSSL
jgi:hypothetical protein